MSRLIQLLSAQLPDRFPRRFLRQEGQDLVEYALIVALISLGAVAGMQTFAADIANAFSSLASTFNGEV